MFSIASHSPGIGDAAKDLLRDARAELGVALEQRCADAVGLAVEGEIELDVQAVGIMVDQLDDLLSAAAMMAEQGEGHGVEDGRLAAAVEAGQHPQRRAVEEDFLLVLVAEETLEPDAQGDHVVSSASSCSASPSMPSRSASSWLASSL